MPNPTRLVVIAAAAIMLVCLLVVAYNRGRVSVYQERENQNLNSEVWCESYKAWRVSCSTPTGDLRLGSLLTLNTALAWIRYSKGEFPELDCWVELDKKAFESSFPN
jgi:hypothetical protein